jgi:hypothetical protein
MSHYDEVLEEARNQATSTAKVYIPKLYRILVDEEHKTAEDARKIIEHDLLEYWSKATVAKHLPQETKDEEKVKAGKAAKQATTLVLAGGETVTTKSDSSESVSPDGNKDEEDPKDTEIQFLKEQVKELEEAHKQVQQFIPATQLENNPSPQTLTDDTVFQYLKDRAKETGDILDFGRVGSGALVQVLTQYKGSFGVVELFGRIVKK